MKGSITTIWRAAASVSGINSADPGDRALGDAGLDIA
jgi:hypothetical protein